MWLNRVAAKRSVFRTRSRIFFLSSQPRWSAMHSAVSPNPVAARLAVLRASGPFAWLRSFTWPVYGFASCQKNRKLAFSISSRRASSAWANLYLIGSPWLETASLAETGRALFCAGAAAICKNQDAAGEEYRSGITPATAPACPSQERLEILGMVNGSSALVVSSVPPRRSGLVTSNHTFVHDSEKRAL